MTELDVVAICQFGPEHGLGHLTRTLAVLHELAPDGAPVFALGKQVDELTFMQDVANSPIRTALDSGEITRVLGAAQPDLLVLDAASLDANSLVSAVRPRWTLILSPLLTTPDGPTIHVHRGTDLPPAWSLRPGNVYALGLGYAIVGQGVLAHLSRTNAARRLASSHSVRIGLAAGAHPSRHALHCLGVLWKGVSESGHRAEAIVASVDCESLKRGLFSVGVSLRDTQFAPIDDPWCVLQHSDVVLVSGGQSLIEAAALRIPFIALPTLPGQFQVAQALQSVGCGWTIAPGAAASRESLMAALNELTLRERRSGTPRHSPIDGRGAWRVGRLIAETFRDESPYVSSA